MDTVWHIFPDRGLDQSILVAVLIGVYVILFFTEIFGWVWAGLVVPGYLASVFAVAPSSGVAVCIEAIATFALSRLLSDLLSRFTGWSAFFGRERFFIIVLISVLVRQSSELWLLPDIITLLNTHAGTAFDPHHQFASIGLVLVPLLANMFWKLTLPRGVFQIGTTVLLTYGVLALVLLPHTNLSFASFESTYEDVALDFLGSPKAYIILLTTAYIAAHGNLMYGWDYNGILVPSLLALTWFTPKALVVSLAEAVLLVFATKAFVKLPKLRDLNLEGPRKLATVFTVGFLLKYLAGWVVSLWVPSVQLTDYFGFGYVLTSLSAVKMLTVKKFGRVLLPTVFVSLVGFVVGSGIGLGLHILWPRAQPAQPPNDTRAHAPRVWGDPTSATLALVARAQAREAALVSTDLAHSNALWSEVQRFLRMATTAPATTAVERLHAAAALAGYALWHEAAATEPMWTLVERSDDAWQWRGLPGAVLWPTRRGPLLLVASPLTDARVGDAALTACERMRCRGILVAGAQDHAGHSPAFERARNHLAKLPQIAIELDGSFAQPTLFIARPLPGDLALAALWQRGTIGSAAAPTPALAHAPEPDVTPASATVNAHRSASAAHATLAISWSPPTRYRPRRPPAAGYATLVLAPDVALTAAGGHGEFAGPWRTDNVRQWLRESTETRHNAGSALGQRNAAAAFAVATAPADIERLLLQRIILPRVLDDNVDLRWRARLARAAGFEVALFAGPRPTDAPWLALRGTQSARGLGLVARQSALLTTPPPGAARPATPAAPPRAVLATHGGTEPGTEALAFHIFLREQAQVLLVNLASPAPGATHVAENRTAWFSAFVALTRLPPPAPGPAPWRWLNTNRADASEADRNHAQAPAIIAVRGLAAFRQVDAQVFVSIGQPIFDSTQVPATVAQLFAPGHALFELAPHRRWVDGRADVVELLEHGSPLLSHVRGFGGASVTLLWFTAELRERFAQNARLKRWEQVLTASQHIALRAEPTEVLAMLPAEAAPPAPHAAERHAQRIEERLRAARHAATTGDVAALLALRQHHQGWYQLAYSPTLDRAYIAVVAGDEVIVLPWLADATAVCPSEIESLEGAQLAGCRELRLSRARQPARPGAPRP